MSIYWINKTINCVKSLFKNKQREHAKDFGKVIFRLELRSLVALLGLLVCSSVALYRVHSVDRPLSSCNVKTVNKEKILQPNKSSTLSQSTCQQKTMLIVKQEESTK